MWQKLTPFPFSCAVYVWAELKGFKLPCCSNTYSAGLQQCLIQQIVTIWDGFTACSSWTLDFVSQALALLYRQSYLLDQLLTFQWRTLGFLEKKIHSPLPIHAKISPVIRKQKILIIICLSIQYTRLSCHKHVIQAASSISHI